MDQQPTPGVSLPFAQCMMGSAPTPNDLGRMVQIKLHLKVHFTTEGVADMTYGEQLSMISI